jgi:hypothetical protein
MQKNILDKNNNKKLFDQNSCLNVINNLTKFYKNENIYNKTDEDNLLKTVIEVCRKERCEPGYYNLYDKCLSG